MTIKYHDNMEQGSDEWHAARCGLITASEVKLILTPTLKVAANDKTRAHMWELLAQRITKHVEPGYIGDAMLRGWTDEITARDLYTEHHAPVTETGFITNDKWGFTLGYSPDGLVGEDGLWEGKSRLQKYQIQTIVEDKVPSEFMMQLQTGLLVTERKWIGFTSYSGGLPMYVKPVFPDAEIQAAIIGAATAFETKLAENMDAYKAALAAMPVLIETERTVDPGAIEDGEY
jgi:predicted phage-related endonuclease